jgi:hypothetical protein
MPKLSTLIRVSVIAACGIIVIKHGARPEPTSRFGLTGVRGMVYLTPIGERVPFLEARQRAPVNVVVAVRSDCPYSRDSLPFYRRISKLKDTSHGEVEIIAVSPEPVETIYKYLVQKGVLPDAVYQVDLGPAGIPGTPTVLLVDANEILMSRFIGKLSNTREDALMDDLESRRKSTSVGGSK